MGEEKVIIVDAGTTSYADEEKIACAVNKAINELNLPSDFIQPDMHVLIKPNLVMDENGNKDGGTECMYTQAAVVKPVIDYVLSRIGKTGMLVVGDAPMQECNFENIKGFGEIIDGYKDQGYNIRLVDFRELKTTVVNGAYHQTINSDANGKVVNLGKYSQFYGMDKAKLKKMRITNYDPHILPTHHHDDIHEYYVSQYVLDADVIIICQSPSHIEKQE